jgi:hypothetical protein
VMAPWSLTMDGVALLSNGVTGSASRSNTGKRAPRLTSRDGGFSWSRLGQCSQAETGPSLLLGGG